MCLQGSPGLSQQTTFFLNVVWYMLIIITTRLMAPLLKISSFFPIIFYCRISDDCGIKKKMVYGSVKDSLTRKLEGTKSIQANDKGDLEFDEVIGVFKK